jgi:hypothetical protein
MFEQLNPHLSLVERIWAEYKDYFTRIEVPARTDLLQEGDIAQKMFFIETGCVRVWNNHDGRQYPSVNLKRPGKWMWRMEKDW